MNMPGFTAEASLYKTSALYHAAIEGAHANESVYAVRPSMLTWPPPPEAFDFRWPPPGLFECFWTCRRIPVGYAGGRIEYITVCGRLC